MRAKLLKSLGPEACSVLHIIGRSRKQKIVIGRDWLMEAFELDGRQLRYQQPEGSFTQPNAGVNRQMLGWACQQAAGLGGNLVELYCGNGNFTMAMAPLFDRVLSLMDLNRAATPASAAA